MRHALATVATLGLAIAALGARPAQQGNGSATLTAEDRTQIQQLVGRYASALGACAADDYAALFVTPGGYFASGPYGKVVGHDKLVDLVLAQTHCVNGTTLGGGRPGNGPAVTIDTSSEGVTGRATLRDHGHYEDVYVKTAEGWRFKSRTHLSPAQEEAGLTPADYEEIRALPGNNAENFRDLYINTPKGPRLRSAGMAIEPSPGGASGTALVADGSGHYEDLYAKSPAGWRFQSRVFVPASHK